jgi:crotonobetainyl-CoA:carnitine CoA-transferase CaiB-like acyl-CoA transferase
MTGVLSGVKVLSMAEQFPGPYATLLLADLGADVILVERFPDGDPSRKHAEFFASLNRNKRSILLNLKSDEGLAAFLDLAATADVILEGYRPGTVDRLGVGYEAVQQRNPRIIYASISAFGQDGPYVAWPGHDLSTEGVGGLLHYLHDPGIDATEDMNPPLVSGDLSSGVFTAFGILAALLRRESTGVGDYLDVAMADCIVSLMTPALVPSANRAPAGTVPGNLSVGSDDPGYGIYRAQDGRCITLSIAYEQHFWDQLCGLLQLPDLVGIDYRERAVRFAELRGRIKVAIVAEPASHWLELFRANSIPAGPVNDLADVPVDPQIKHRKMLAGVAGSDSGRVYTALPVLFDTFGRGSIERDVPTLGQHTDEVLAEIARG